MCRGFDLLQYCSAGVILVPRRPLRVIESPDGFGLGHGSRSGRPLARSWGLVLGGHSTANGSACLGVSRGTSVRPRKLHGRIVGSVAPPEAAVCVYPGFAIDNRSRGAKRIIHPLP